MAFSNADKENIKTFIRLVIDEQNRRIASSYAPASQLAVVKADIYDIKKSVDSFNPSDFVEKEDGKTLSSYDYSATDKALLTKLAASSNEGFTADDLADIFD